MQYAWQFGEEQVNNNPSNYEMLRMILEANLKLMELSEQSLKEEKELITYSVLKGMMQFGRTMEKSFDLAES
tara:strand:- start:1571 stop:1786 length:216 start_codon:yes stop_codon:yes gene_type:complete